MLGKGKGRELRGRVEIGGQEKGREQEVGRREKVAQRACFVASRISHGRAVCWSESALPRSGTRPRPSNSDGIASSNSKLRSWLSESESDFA